MPWDRHHCHVYALVSSYHAKLNILGISTVTIAGYVRTVVQVDLMHVHRIINGVQVCLHSREFCDVTTRVYRWLLWRCPYRPKSVTLMSVTLFPRKGVLSRGALILR